MCFKKSDNMSKNYYNLCLSEIYEKEFIKYFVFSFKSQKKIGTAQLFLPDKQQILLISLFRRHRKVVEGKKFSIIIFKTKTFLKTTVTEFND